MKILIIEDDDKILDTLRLLIRTFDKDITILSASTGKEGIKVAARESLNLIILDLGLPDMSGIDVIQSIKLIGSIPVVILTIQESEQTILQAFELGVEDYIIKPFRPLELVARIRAVLMRTEPSQQFHPNVTFGKWRFGISICDLRFGNNKFALTVTEGRLFQKLMSTQGEVVSYNEFAKVLWGSKTNYSPNTLKVYINRIRKKIEPIDSNKQLIFNIPGIGYYLKSY
ncbi:transcriptional regulator [Dehalococcoides mccartyi]|jgi:two-component system KDP operon response regulator KdpE|uniref:response regulator transcription factor n=1 Tax=Dehalococcoides mccartyi TaxID=61435 RepID=UPI0002B76665|nr:response regulator transcription factor [Dehalococcoides mccartyi]AGG08486.1 signal transduction response regulator, OmpR family [Dehalococcoides mccartyi BTF08]KSV17327.1 transcriptional regulator [Dehalococcoides mccartyi]